MTFFTIIMIDSCETKIHHEVRLLSTELNSDNNCGPKTKVIEQSDFGDDNIRVFNFKLSKEMWEDFFNKIEVNSMFDSVLNVYLHYFHMPFSVKKKGGLI